MGEITRNLNRRDLRDWSRVAQSNLIFERNEREKNEREMREVLVIYWKEWMA